MVNMSRSVLGGGLTDAVLRRTMFAHFCGGEDSESIKPVIASLDSQGIGSILDYAAESDIEAGEGAAAQNQLDLHTIVCRTYTYEDEAECDRNADIFKQAVRAVKQSSVGDAAGFAAIKVTALGPPELLKRVSSSVREMRRLFSRMDLNGDRIIPKAEFIAACHTMFEGDTALFASWFDELHGTLAAAQDGIDYVEWLETMTLEQLPRMLSRCKDRGPLSDSQIEEGELALLAAARRRSREVVAEAQRCGVRVLIDAEHSYFQPAIDLLATEMMREFNRGQCTVFNTYQAYLKDSEERVHADMQRAARVGYTFACKVVRGAYLEHEAKYAKLHGQPNPIHDSIEDTHSCYDRCVAKVLQAVGPLKAECMVATHNQASVEHAIARMSDLGLAPTDSVYFGQLLGMSDHLTGALGAGGYRAYKYLPWGPVSEVTPYLLRRAQENSAIVGGAKAELKQLNVELRRRFLCWSGLD